MKIVSLSFAVWTLLALAGSASDLQKSSVLTFETRQKIRAFANPYLMDIFLPEECDGAKVPVSSVPERARKDAAVWIPKVVQAKWLPTDIDSKLVALKDVKQWEKRDRNGVLISERIGDSLALEYQASGYRIHVHESGVSVSLRVEFPEAMSVGDDPDAFIRKCLTDFLNIPDEVVAQLQGDVKEERPVYFAHLRSPLAVEKHLALLRTRRVTPADRDRWMKERRWWDRVYACTDGRFFFVSVSEVEPGSNPRAKGGLPDRF